MKRTVLLLACVAALSTAFAAAEANLKVCAAFPATAGLKACPTSGVPANLNARTARTGVAQGPSAVAQGPSKVAQGPSAVAQGPSKVAQGPSAVAHGPSAVAQGPSAVAQGPSEVAQGFSPANTTLTAVDGIKVGSYTLPGGTTGCTVILVDGEGVPGGISQRGGAPGTRETDLLNPLNMVDKINAIVLSGGSAFGLDSATGTSKWLEEHNIGWDVRIARVPIVPAAILFDLPVGNNAKNHPGADCGYKAVEAATTAPVSMGTVGAGAGATVGKMGGPGTSMKGGLGSAALRMPNGLVVAAIVAVNAAGDILDPDTGKVIAGARKPDGTLVDVRTLLRSGALMQRRGAAPRVVENTTIGLVATNAKLTKAEVSRMALMGDDGYARAIFPSHTMGDGDTVFSLATGRWNGQADVSLIGALAADAMAKALVQAVTQATGLPNIPAVRDLK
jgi:L-aminopeptidase/D-esterase-like protein